ncbi:hypothetical protein STBA_02140 [Streptomyces sp. MP131-18]|nr:hypothetical protein STBA_02140 [Streptomyces sp. MP131-18]
MRTHRHEPDHAHKTVPLLNTGILIVSIGSVGPSTAEARRSNCKQPPRPSSAPPASSTRWGAPPRPTRFWRWLATRCPSAPGVTRTRSPMRCSSGPARSAPTSPAPTCTSTADRPDLTGSGLTPARVNVRSLPVSANPRVHGSERLVHRRGCSACGPRLQRWPRVAACHRTAATDRNQERRRAPRHPRRRDRLSDFPRGSVSGASVRAPSTWVPERSRQITSTPGWSAKQSMRVTASRSRRTSTGRWVRRSTSGTHVRG